MPHARRGFTLIELIVTIVILFLLVLLILPAILGQRERGCGRPQCLNNLRQVGLALINFDSAQNRLPNSGTWATELDVTGTTTGGAASPLPGWPSAEVPDGLGLLDDPNRNDIRWDFPLHSWVVDILPYMERADMADQWKATERQNTAGFGAKSYALFDEKDHTPGAPVNGYERNHNVPTHYSLSLTYLALLVCPDDDSIQGGKGNLSYVVNGGPTLLWQHPNNNASHPAWLGLAQGGYSPTGHSAHDHKKDDQAAAKNMGLMYPGSLRGNSPWDSRSSLSRVPDGISTTIMVSENLRAGYDPAIATTWYDPNHMGQPGTAGFAEGTWSNPDPFYCAFHMSDDICNSAGDCKTGAWEKVLVGTIERSVIRAKWSNANRKGAGNNAYGYPESINGLLSVREGWPYLSSYHPGGVFVVMCDGSARFLSQDIDGEVLAKLVSPAGTKTMKESWPAYQSTIAEEDF